MISGSSGFHHMPKAKKKKPIRGTSSPAAPGGQWLYEMDTDALQLACCTRFHFEAPATREETITAIQQVPTWCRDLGRARTTKIFAVRLKIWRSIVARGRTPTLQSIPAFWLHDLHEDALRMMCVSLGISIEGDYNTLLSRLEATPNITKYRPYMTTTWWAHRIEHKEDVFAKYTPDGQAPIQYRYSSVPTVDVSRNEWLGTL